MDRIDTREIILGLKATQKERNLSIQDIMQLLSDAHMSLGETTVRRVFKDGSEDHDSFNYDLTLRPLIEALAVYGKSDAEAKLLIATNQYKDRLIEELQSQKERLMAQYERRCEEYEKRMSFLRNQIELKDTRMDRKDAIIEKLLDKVLVCGKCPVDKDGKET